MRFYDDDGRTTKGGLASARKVGGKPSVTTILDVLAKPGVEFWKQNLLLETAFDTVIRSSLPIYATYKKTWKGIVQRKVKEISSVPTDIGTKYHEEIAACLSGKQTLNELEHVPKETMAAIIDGLDARNIEIEALEKTIVGSMYAGTVDLIGKQDGKKIIVDWKTQDDPLKYYKSWGYQLGGYANLVGEVGLAYNVVISRETPGRVKWFKWKNVLDLELGFDIIHNAWILENNWNVASPGGVFIEKPVEE